MSTQLKLFSDGSGDVAGYAGPHAWELDEETRRLGRLRLAEARAILRGARHPVGPADAATAQPAA